MGKGSSNGMIDIRTFPEYYLTSSVQPCSYASAFKSKQN
ncbi:hypothetical protein SLEP1_g37518 [Rubroshorea leprosula]|uniref:Uncharacterized protein n=1 Tax=Rubroshorea leprosula TaxID=152421 RepID=A0AAV5KV62_9ROSI|nr:hypothetical protein SLEP1_g37518 [Rubroshorea leprosula]